ncbi:MAG: dihydrodipicolinate synthase family protein [Pseudomonadota bacterium]
MVDAVRLEGVIAPVITPFDDDGEPDAERFVAHAKWLLENGCHALAPFGTTSEGNSIGLEERMELLEELVDAGVAPELLMPGTGTCSVSDTVFLTQHAMDLGCGGVLVLPPFFYKSPSDEGLFRFFSGVIEETADDTLAVYLYHIPQMSGVGFSLDLIHRLRGEYPENVVGLKDSSGDWANMQRILDEVPDFDLFPGSELFLLDALKKGAAGIISAFANVNSAMMRELYDDPGSDAAEDLQARISAFRKIGQNYPLVQGSKAIIAHYSGDPQWSEVRPPLDPMSAEDQRRLISDLEGKLSFSLTIDREA